jgi:hypothetical protein
MLLVISAPATALETKAYQMNEDFGEPNYDTALQYYYYIPCPTYSWFWSFSGWTPGEIVGEMFQIGDLSTGVYYPADPAMCYEIDRLRVLDFAGYGPAYPGRFTIEFDVYCCDENGCPVGPSLWNSGPRETAFGWSDFEIDSHIDISECRPDPGSGPRVLVTATHTGSEGYYPAWGMDNISTYVQTGCLMHEIGCHPAIYPRPYSSHYNTIHSGFYGQAFQHCPPLWFADGSDTTPEGTDYGFVELAWRLYVYCPWHATESATWSSIKSVYR